jgi:hypothetical protein
LLEQLELLGLARRFIFGRFRFEQLLLGIVAGTRSLVGLDLLIIQIIAISVTRAKSRGVVLASVGRQRSISHLVVKLSSSRVHV